MLTPKFRDLQYQRPNIDEFTQCVRDIRLRLMTTQNPDQAMEIIAEYEKQAGRFETMYSLCMIKHDLDTSDAYYASELEYYDEVMPVVSEMSSAVLTGITTCPCADLLRERYGNMIFLKAVNQKETVSPEVLEDLSAESALENRYSQLQSEAEIEFGGRLLNLSGIMPYMESTDREMRKEAHLALDRYYQSRKEEYDRIYGDLVSVRTTIARKLGFDNFTQLGYKRMERYDYNSEDVRLFRDNIVKYIVPITVQIRKLQQERLGTGELKFYDLPCLFRNGNPTPVVPGEGYERAAGDFFDKIFGVSPSFFDILSENGYTDLLSRKSKSTGGYCVYLNDYAIPYIFMNGNGTFDDVSTVIHEGGHAYAAIQSSEVSPFMECLSPTLETCEIHSMAMEFLAYPSMEIFFAEKADQYRQLHMTDALLFLPYGCMVDEFQHIVYDNPEMSAADRHDVWKKLEEKYQPFIDYGDEFEFHRMGGAWMKKDHIFTTPFYYIDYCLAQICAMQLWDESRKDMKSALKKYSTLCASGGNDTFLNLIKQAGILSPFDTGVIKQLAYSACDFLNL